MRCRSRRSSLDDVHQPRRTRSRSLCASRPAACAWHTTVAVLEVYASTSDLSVHSAADLDWVAQELNDRPRKRLGFAKPIEQIGELLQQ